MSGLWVEIASDDSIESVAFRHGHFPETLWNHPQNAALQQERRSMHVLLAGDRVFVPAIAPKAVACDTGRTHRFRRRAVPSRLSLKLAIGSQPIADRPCRIELEGRAPVDARTDADGFVQVPAMPDAGRGRIVVELQGGQSLVVDLAPRRLDPVDTPTGAQARLRNLGYLAGEAEGVLDLPTVLALTRLQQDRGIEVTGALDDATKAALLSAHGG
jgi:hypothetical protein